MPPRKTSNSPPYAARSNHARAFPQTNLSLANLRLRIQTMFRRDRLKVTALGIITFLVLVWILRRLMGFGGTTGESMIGGVGAPVVVVTAFDAGQDQAWVDRIKKNRLEYAKRHGYKTFFTTSDSYKIVNSPLSWSKVPALRHAMTVNPTSMWFWYLDSTSLIMNPSIPITSHILNPQRIEASMIVNEPVVPPDSVIKTFANLRGERIDFVITQDKEGLSVQSFVVRRGEWAKYFLDAWFDPIYRSYNFQKAEGHALEHIVQWHGTILAKLALVPQNIFNSYAKGGQPNPKSGEYKDGDLVASFPGCEKKDRSCASEMKPFFEVLERRKIEGN